MNEDCALCNGLWREYAKATTEHVRLLREEESPGWDLARFRKLESEIDVAAGVRARARIAIKIHLSKDHGEGVRSVASAQPD